MSRRERSARMRSTPRSSSTLPEVQQQCCTATRKVNGKHMNAPAYQAATMLLQLYGRSHKTLIQQRTSAARVFAHHTPAATSHSDTAFPHIVSDRRAAS